MPSKACSAPPQCLYLDISSENDGIDSITHRQEFHKLAIRCGFQPQHLITRGFNHLIQDPHSRPTNIEDALLPKVAYQLPQLSPQQPRIQQRSLCQQLYFMQII